MEVLFNCSAEADGLTPGYPIVSKQRLKKRRRIVSRNRAEYFLYRNIIHTRAEEEMRLRGKLKAPKFGWLAQFPQMERIDLVPG